MSDDVLIKEPKTADELERELAVAHGLIGRLVLLLFQENVDGDRINAAISGDKEG